MARLIAETETLTPRFSSHISQWRSKVASSFSSSCSHRAFFSSSCVARMRRLSPVETPGERFLPSLLILSQRLSVVREISRTFLQHPSPRYSPIHRSHRPDL